MCPFLKDGLAFISAEIYASVKKDERVCEGWQHFLSVEGLDKPF